MRPPWVGSHLRCGLCDPECGQAAGETAQSTWLELLYPFSTHQRLRQQYEEVLAPG